MNELLYLSLASRKTRNHLRGSLLGLALFVGRSRRLLATVLFVNAGAIAFSNLAAQVQAPAAADVSPTVNAEVSSIINTGSGYDAWTGSAHRQVTDHMRATNS